MSDVSGLKKKIRRWSKRATRRSWSKNGTGSSKSSPPAVPAKAIRGADDDTIDGDDYDSGGIAFLRPGCPHFFFLVLFPTSAVGPAILRFGETARVGGGNVSSS